MTLVNPYLQFNGGAESTFTFADQYSEGSFQE
jgi:hypothetical protein